MKSSFAQVHFNEQGTPVADNFDDVYFSNDSGIDETQHVFVDGNDLLARWAQHTRAVFVIGETGFGTGLNCLVAIDLFNQFRAQHPDSPLTRLHIVSTEKFPLAFTDWQQAVDAFSSLSTVVEQIAPHYPLPLAGCHRITLPQSNTTLDIWIGDIHETMPTWHCPNDGLVDAWFLDGFAPSKNPEMWTDALFSQLARLSKPDATFATFTAAGVVKRGLKEAGFEIKKRNGFGRKRDMLTGWVASPATQRDPAPCYYRYRKTLSPDASVAVVGGGLAGASLALALVQKGLSVSLYTKGQLADSASGNPQGGFYPQLHAEASHASQIQAHSYLFARQQYDQLLQTGHSFAHQWCGVLQLAFNDSTAKRHDKMISAQLWPHLLMQGMHKDEVEEKAGIPLPYPGIYFPHGGWISPPELVQAMVAYVQSSGKLTLYTDYHLTHYQDNSSSVALHFDNNEVVHHEHLILAPGYHSVEQAFMQDLPIRAVRGQVEQIEASPPYDKLATVLCHKGYMTPQHQGSMALGSTYVKQDLSLEVRSQETQMNLATHQNAIPNADWVNHIQTRGQARASVRLSTPDHQPHAGNYTCAQTQYELFEHLHKTGKLGHTQAPDYGNVSVLTGLGSRGLTTAPMMAEIVASQLTGHPLPMPNALLQALSPNRHIVRDSIKGQR